ncbi:MAG: UvrB/UvrC motif-containing protein, partial [Desulfobulbaceae bacterium]|nr:UvrB/UvrC motif-containing protein [Desulfobulbaceae bacterium]
QIQFIFNEKHGITPQTVCSSIKDSLRQHLKSTGYPISTNEEQTTNMIAAEPEIPYHNVKDLHAEILRLEKEMQRAAKELAFEEAAGYRDTIKELKKMELYVG